MAAHQRVLRRNRRQQVRLRVPRVFKDRSNPLEDLREVFERYRFKPDTIMFIMSILPDLSFVTLRNCPIPPVLLVTLRFLATGAMHLLLGDSVNISRSTSGRIVRRTTALLAALARQYVKFPSPPRANEIKKGFAKIAGFPNVLGCIDGTFIRIRRPKENEVDFVNRKGYHSLNVQMCCDHTFRITSCYASWPGSVHDSRVFRCSALCAQFENGEHDGLLLGDSGYPCRHFLMTPFLNPANPAQTRYNESLCRTRVLIEQTFGILKRRFQILHFEMSTNPRQAAINTVACVVLHNIGIVRGDIIPLDDLDIEPNDQPAFGPAIQQGYAMRDHIVQTFFA